LGVRVRVELMTAVDRLARRSLACWQRCQQARRNEFRSAMRALPTLEALLAIPRQRLDAAADRLPRALRANAQIHHTALSRIAGRLMPRMLDVRIRREHERVAALAQRANQCLRVHVERRRDRFNAAASRLSAALRANAEARRVLIERSRERFKGLLARAERAMRTLVDRRCVRLERAAGLLAALSYHGVLARGFALVRDPAGAPLRAASGVSPGLVLDIEFADGHVGAVATSGGGDAMVSFGASRAKPKRGGGEGQGSLF
jgi:exodeoxyribonuclease VII large subunit